MSRRLTGIVWLVSLLFSVPGFGGYDNLADWASLPRSKSAIRAGLASSYDRAGGNSDFSQYESPVGLQLDPGLATVKTLTGPGELTRFWMPHLTAKRSFDIKMYFDGETTPRIDTTSDVWLNGNYAYMQGPLVTTAAGGQVSYEPIAFQQSLRIETWNKDLPDNNAWSSDRHYYQYSYHLYSAGGPAESYTGTLTASQQSQREQVTALLSNVGQNPAGLNPGAVTLASSGLTVSAHSSVSLAQIGGSGAVRKLCVKMNNSTDAELEGLRIRIRYDGMDSAAVDVPVAHFFGAGYGRAAYQSLPLGTDSDDGFYSYWPMPYRQGLSIELYNSTDVPISLDGTKVEYENRAVGLDEHYFHSAFSAETTSAGQQYHSLLNVSGEGHYVGNLLWLGNDESVGADILEGDELITADGETLFGTGLEDAYNGGYYYNWVGVQSDEPEGPKPDFAIRPYYGLLNLDPKIDPATERFTGLYRADQYRWHIADFVPFDETLDVKIENFGGRGDVDFGSTAFYYLAVSIPGDANRDGMVNVGDLGILAYNYGTPTDATWSMGDFNGDGKVNVGDLGILAGNYGYSVGEASASLPEPVTLLWFGSGVLILQPFRKYRICR
jgi:hypothetical protein